MKEVALIPRVLFNYLHHVVTDTLMIGLKLTRVLLIKGE